MTCWEYSSIDTTIYALPQRLAEAGEAGWEAWHLEMKRSNGRCVVMLKRGRG